MQNIDNDINDFHNKAIMYYNKLDIERKESVYSDIPIVYNCPICVMKIFRDRYTFIRHLQSKSHIEKTKMVIHCDDYKIHFDDCNTNLSCQQFMNL